MGQIQEAGEGSKKSVPDSQQGRGPLQICLFSTENAGTLPSMPLHLASEHVAQRRSPASPQQPAPRIASSLVSPTMLSHPPALLRGLQKRIPGHTARPEQGPAQENISQPLCKSDLPKGVTARSG